MNSLGAWYQNTFLNRKRYRVHKDAVIIACFYNPQCNPYRLIAFQKWYRSIRHLPHRIIECLIGDAKSQLPKSPNITQVYTDSMLWHKEALLNKIVRELPSEFKYVFWLDADVLFTNLNWITDSVKQLQNNAIVQPFSYCIHLKKNELKPDFNVEVYRGTSTNAIGRHPQMWKGFGAVHVEKAAQARSDNYEHHGHVGFAWGARREILEMCPLYDKGLVGGGDHIIAHAAVGHIPHGCIRRAFGDDIEAVEHWSHKFHAATNGKLGAVEGDLYHIWHGDVKARDYFNVVKSYTGTAAKVHVKDHNGLYVATSKEQDEYVKKHYARREARNLDRGGDFEGIQFDAEFVIDMGYHLGSLIRSFGEATYDDPIDEPGQADVDTFSVPPEAPEAAPAQAAWETQSFRSDPPTATSETFS